MYSYSISDVLRSVALRWKYQYFTSKGNRWFDTVKAKSEEIYKDLLSATTKEEVDTIIGNKSWTRLQCNECGSEVDKVVFLEGTHEYGPNAFCKACIEKALQLFGETDTKPQPRDSWPGM